METRTVYVFAATLIGQPTPPFVALFEVLPSERVLAEAVEEVIGQDELRALLSDPVFSSEDAEGFELLAAWTELRRDAFESEKEGGLLAFRNGPGPVVFSVQRLEFLDLERCT